ncbi:MAG: bifunctional diaminohydroxyphosphoribosylaminopyrimidine deaminase/5-amino-6-(5-phosphoribosylamino)uracil reductase RibD [Proteobacteria bacterium]|nr:bifunctional diaminohydroxyphosphoribosylaminopyrimidine deaminase/5-amino-6-(5-phosphoribosylamino)uracil reductase RibD [Pseudomonadota bacterium]
MARALRLAERGLFTTQPNPRVGCVIAQGGEIVGEGWHQRAGEPHAEVFALRAAGARTLGAIAYTTLEPCSHQGRTPPCADALVAAGIARVVVASDDPNPKVAGAGLQRLRAAGIAVETGLMREAARDLNRGFFSRFERGQSWVRVKLAMSLDGRTALANGESKWITGAAARADVQRWRARSSAILTGAGTARADDPRLTVRLHETRLRPLPPPEGEGFKAVRVVLDARLDALQPDAHLLDGSTPTLVLHAPGAQPRDGRYSRAELAVVERGTDGRLELAAVLTALAARGVNELQVEAGPGLCGALFQQGLVDELLLYVAPTVLGDTARPLLALPPLADMAARRNLRVIDQRMLGSDRRLLLRPA